MRNCPRCLALLSDDVEVCPHDGTPVTEPPPWPEGTIVEDKYRIVSQIGQDLICTVYKATEVKTDKPFSLHVMSWGLACDAEFVNLFEQDAVERKKLQHPNVARVEGTGHADDGRPFIIMEYVAGQSLKKFIELEAPFAPLRACYIAGQVAAALEAAHAMGMIHRDVKPETIYLLDPTGDQLKLIGLGISKLREALLGDRFRNSPEAVIGTFQYLSPEQALGQLGSQLDGRADIYSLGVVMYQMLTRELPFKATTDAHWMMAHIQELPIPIRVAHANLAIPNVVTNLVMQCLQKDRDSRPADARQLILSLERAAKEINDFVPPPPPSPKTPTLDARKADSKWKFWKSS